MAIHKFTKLIAAGTEIPIYGDGSARRDFTFIDDIIHGVVNSIERCNGYNIYNLGESEPIYVNDLVIEIEKALGKKAKKEYLPKQPGDVERTFADISKAKKELGYNPQTPIQTGLEKFVTWLKKEMP